MTNNRVFVNTGWDPTGTTDAEILARIPAGYAGHVRITDHDNGDLVTVYVRNAFGVWVVPASN